MKTLKNQQITVTGDKITITADIVDEPFSEFLISRTTHGYFNPVNEKHHRHVQSSNEAVFVKCRHGQMAMSNDFIVAVAAAVEPCTSFAPVFKTTSLTAEVSSESEVSYKWQVSDDPAPKGTFPPPAAVWTNINCTSAICDTTLVKTGQWVRCVAKNATGETIGEPIEIK